jgi:hypothetical protein
LNNRPCGQTSPTFAGSSMQAVSAEDASRGVKPADRPRQRPAGNGRPSADGPCAIGLAIKVSAAEAVGPFGRRPSKYSNEPGHMNPDYLTGIEEAAGRGVGDQGERLAREVVHNRQNPKPPAPGTARRRRSRAISPCLRYRRSSFLRFIVILAAPAGCRAGGSRSAGARRTGRAASGGSSV